MQEVGSNLTEINDLKQLEEQGNNVQQSSLDFSKTIEMIYQTYDQTNKFWKGKQADKHKEIIERMREPLMCIVETLSKKGEGISSAAKALREFEEGA